MDRKFYDTVIGLLDDLNIHFRETEVLKVSLETGKPVVKMFLTDSFCFKERDLSEAPVVPCLIIFAMFDCYAEDKFSLPVGENFKSRYERILNNASNSNERLSLITGECYRLIRLIRNCFVHNMSGIGNDGSTFHFQHRNNNLKISVEMLHLLYYIIVLLVKGSYVVSTRGHFESAVIKYYGKLQRYIAAYGNFSDDLCSLHGGLSAVTEEFNFKVGSRYCVENAAYLIIFNPCEGSEMDRMQITENYRAIDSIVGGIDYSENGTDYLVNYSGNSYVIPLEVLDENNSIRLSELEKWKKILKGL